MKTPTENEIEKEIEELVDYGDEQEYYKQDVLKAKLEGYKLGQKDERENQYSGNCTICGKEDDFSESTICSTCISKWKNKIEEKAKEEFKKKIEELKTETREWLSIEEFDSWCRKVNKIFEGEGK